MDIEAVVDVSVKRDKFAARVGLAKLFWVLMISALLGDLIETVFMWIVEGRIMSRSSVLYGPFSLVWGFGGVVTTLTCCPLRRFGKRRGYKVYIVPALIFIMGVVAGGFYEYICSWFTESLWGIVYWDYSHIPYNIHGRVNLMYCLYWGVAALAWVYIVYPFVNWCIERVSMNMGKVITWVVATLMIINVLLSIMALERYMERDAGIMPATAMDTFLDEAYPDNYIDKVYPNLIVK